MRCRSSRIFDVVLDHTEKESIQAFIRHVLINQKFFISLQAATKKSNQIPML
jgi:hypothetical protein